MGKRPFRGLDGHSGKKRQKIIHEAPTHEEVTSARQLKKLLAFDQDARQARHGLQSFKLFLDSLNAKDATAETKTNGFELLGLYLESARPRIEGPDAVYLTDIMETWSFGVKVENEAIMSGVAVVLSLLLHTISGTLELLPHARGLCETILQESHLKLVARNLSADKGKAFVISPTLRLLCEVVSLDGGAFSRRLFRDRHYSFAFFARNLEIGHQGDAPEDNTKASVRTNAIRLFLNCLRYLPADAKTELLKMKGVMSTITYLLNEDPPWIVSELLEYLKTYILKDKKTPTRTKSLVFSVKTLVRLLNLYNYSHDADTENESEKVATKLHNFLKFACTDPSSGILVKSSGFYPSSLTSEASARAQLDWRDMGVERLSWMQKYKDAVPVENTTLLEMTTKLRPWASMKHSELLVAILEAAPELVAAYFQEQKSFTFDPKLSMTWIGYASFLFSVIQSPIPQYFGHPESKYSDIPPPTTIVLNSIVPPPLNQKVLIRCLDPKSPLVSFFTTRLLVIALEKLNSALALHREASSEPGSLWSDAREKLLDEFCQRIPDMKDVMRCYKSIPEKDLVRRATASRLLLLYYQTVPQIALSANIDVAPFLVSSLNSLDEPVEEPQDQLLKIMDLENILVIASYSPGMRWFARLESISASPFLALLKAASYEVDGLPLERLRETLNEIATDHQIVLSKTGLDPLTRAFKWVKDTHSGSIDSAWQFLDKCLVKCATSPIKYLDLVTDYVDDQTSSSNDAAVSLLTATMVEQLPYSTETELEVITQFISAYFGYSVLAGEERSWLEAMMRYMGKSLPDNTRSRLSIPKEIQKLIKSHKPRNPENPAPSPTGADSSNPLSTAAHKSHQKLDQSTLEETFYESLSIREDNSALTKWVSKTDDEIIEDEHFPALAALLLSEHGSIRREALTNILKMAARIRESTHEEKEQIWLLLSELAESSRPFIDSGTVPSAFVGFASHALPVLRNPLHCLYPKINTFLTRAPVWPAGKIPMLHSILHGEPGEDDKYYSELSWLFTYLPACLRTPADLGIFRERRWFEKIFAAACNPYMRSTLRRKVLTLLYRATCIEGGSTALITRFGAVVWLENLISSGTGDGGATGASNAEDDAIYRALIERLWLTCDQERVSSWSKNGIQGVLVRVEA